MLRVLSPRFWLIDPVAIAGILAQPIEGLTFVEIPVIVLVVLIINFVIIINPDHQDVDNDRSGESRPLRKEKK